MTTNGNAAIKVEENNIINIGVLLGGKETKTQKMTLDGRPKMTHSNHTEGSCEVYPLDEEEQRAVLKVAVKHIEEAKNADQLRTARRNKLYLIVGMNVGLRASDLTEIKWDFFLEQDGSFKNLYTLKPKKTRKTGKYVKIYHNEAVRRAVQEYLSYYPVEDLNAYVFASRQSAHIGTASAWAIVNDYCAEAGIKKNVGSHTLRKTWGATLWHNAQDKTKALVMLQTIFNHSSSSVTARYIGIMDNEIADLFASAPIGLEFV